MKDILQQIVDNKRREIEVMKKAIPFSELEKKIERSGFRKCSFRESLETTKGGIIAEFKRRSPSKGWIKEKAKVEVIVPDYVTAGAAACSILTDEDFFGGKLDDLEHARSLVKAPLLRKDFIIDDYQLYQAVSCGADAVLLIAACLPEYKCTALAQLAKHLGLEVLLEVHSRDELSYLSPYVDMLGVNNRHLGTFDTDVKISFDMAEMMQKVCLGVKNPPLLISESGISSPEVVRELQGAGFKGFLMGETFMKSPNPGKTLSDFIAKLT